MLPSLTKLLLFAVCATALCVCGRPTRAADTDAPPALPTIPSAVFRVTDYGAVGDSNTLNTDAIARAVAACAKAGGGTVDFPPGRYLTGPFALASGLNLKVEAGATIVLSDDPRNWKLRDNRFENAIVADNAHDVEISGGGTIDGQGALWWKNYVLPRNAPAGTLALAHRPYLIVLSRCTRVLVRDITLTNSPSFHLVPQQCRDVTLTGVRIVAPAKSPNTDGIDPSGIDFLIDHCTFDVGDDCIALKPAAPIDSDHAACENFLIQNCTFLHGHGMSIGGQTPGGLRHLIVRDSTFDSTETGIRLKAPRGQGGLVEDLLYQRLTMKNVHTPILITSYYPSIPRDPAQDPAQPVTPRTPTWRDIRIEDVSATGATQVGRIIGLPEMPVDKVTLIHVRLSGKEGWQIVHARGLRFIYCTDRVDRGPALTTQDAEVTAVTTSNSTQEIPVLLGSDAPATKIPSPAPVSATTTEWHVDPSAADGYRTIQAAIDAVPAHNSRRVTITIAPGTYAEALHIGQDRPLITLRGAGAGRDAVVVRSGDKFPTLTADDSDLRVENLTLENTAGATAGPNQALITQGDRQIFENVVLKGWQDTVWIRAEKTRAYFHRCAIWGSVDFIYGAGTALFDHCDIVERRPTGGVIAAPSTPQDHPYGLIFQFCHLVNATGKPNDTTLARPWRLYGAATFLGCTLDDHITPAGWREWDGREKTCRFGEFGSVGGDGKAVDVGGRVRWAHELSADEAAKFTVPALFGDWDPVVEPWGKP